MAGDCPGRWTDVTPVLRDAASESGAFMLRDRYWSVQIFFSSFSGAHFPKCLRDRLSQDICILLSIPLFLFMGDPLSGSAQTFNSLLSLSHNLHKPAI
jgi:hypothetical protein